jgi:hypothetical protein
LQNPDAKPFVQYTELDMGGQEIKNREKRTSLISSLDHYSDQS